MPRPRIHVTAPVPIEVDEALRRDFETSDSPEGVDGILAMLTTRVDGAYLDRAGCRTVAVRRFSSERMVGEHIRIYEELLSGPEPSGRALSRRPVRAG